jgi:osmotically-inducible protein OsmY
MASRATRRAKAAPTGGPDVGPNAQEKTMTLETKALPALAAGALLALGAAGCASDWRAGSASEPTTYRSDVTMNQTTTQEPRGNRNAVMATLDDQMTRDIEQALHAAGGVDARGVVVRTLRGHVELTGTVADEEQRRRVLEIARNTDVERVVDVTDNLRVAG